MNQKFYGAFGVLTSAFAQMEADIRILLAGIAFRGETIYAAAFLDGSHLSENLVTLRKISLSFLGEEHRFIEIIEPLDAIRRKRNLFIHGLWSPKNFGEPNGYAVVRELRTRSEEKKGGRMWKHGNEERFSFSDFETLLASVNDISKKIEGLCSWLEKNEEVEFGYIGFTSKNRSIVDYKDLSSVIRNKKEEQNGTG